MPEEPDSSSAESMGHGLGCIVQHSSAGPVQDKEQLVISQWGDTAIPSLQAAWSWQAQGSHSALASWKIRRCLQVVWDSLHLPHLLMPGEMSSQHCTCIILICWCFEKELFKHFAGSSSVGVKTYSLSKVAGRWGLTDGPTRWQGAGGVLTGTAACTGLAGSTGSKHDHPPFEQGLGKRHSSSSCLLQVSST